MAHSRAFGVLALLLRLAAAHESSNGTLSVCAVLEMTKPTKGNDDGSGVSAGEPCGGVIPNVRAMVAAVNELHDGRGFAVGAFGAEPLYFRLNFTARVFDHGNWSTEGVNLSRALFPSCHYVVNMGSGCPSSDTVFIEQAQIAKEAGAIAVTNRGPPEVLKTAQNDHFFSIHVSSDEYPTLAIRQYELRESTATVAVVGESAENAFFRGVTHSAAKKVNHSLQLTLAVHAQFVPEDVGAARAGAQAAIAARADVLIFSGSRNEWKAVLDVTHAARAEHVFKSIWATNVPWGGGTCNELELANGTSQACGHVVGATQLYEEESQFTDALLGQSGDGLNYVADRTDIRAGISAWVQAVQTVFEFRAIPDPAVFLAAPAEAELVREYMRSGAILGETFYGPVAFNALGQNKGRDPTTVQASRAGQAAVIFPIEHAIAKFEYPSPAASECGRNYYAKRSNQRCSLCNATCSECPENTNAFCECSPGFYEIADPADPGALPTCSKCPNGADCGSSTRARSRG